VRRGALSARQAARVDPGVLMDGQRICAATCKQEAHQPEDWSGGFGGAINPGPPRQGKGFLKSTRQRASL
jgi:hypothetical protein